MRKYKLLKDLPTFKAGEIFRLEDDGCLYWQNADQADHTLAECRHCGTEVMAYHRRTIERFPDMLTDWFEEIEEEKTSWMPEKGEAYYWIDGEGAIFRDHFCEDAADISGQELGNMFKTQEDAEKAVEWLKARKILLDDTEGFKWKKRCESCTVGWSDLSCDSVDPDALDIISQGHFKTSEIIFGTEEDAKRSIKRHAKEWRIYLGVDE